ncbi:hypothetical protein D3C86_1437650 [compost metagenome]
MPASRSLTLPSPRKPTIASARARASSRSRRARPRPTSCSMKLERAASTRPSTMLSRTLSPLKSARFWKVRATPSRASRAVGTWPKLRPPIHTRPRSGRYSPLMTLTSELLPAPFGPMTARISPLAIDRSTPNSAVTPPKDRSMPSSCSTAEVPESSPAAAARPAGTKATGSAPSETGPASKRRSRIARLTPRLPAPACCGCQHRRPARLRACAPAAAPSGRSTPPLR